MTAPSDPILRAPVFRMLGLVLLGLAPGVVAVDSWVGWLDREQGAREEGLLAHDEELGWVNRPFFANELTQTDRLGLRNRPFPEDPPADEARILGVGASRLFGAGGATQDILWNSVLQERYDAEYDGRVRVLNGGVMAYSAVQASRRAIRLIEQVEPDVVFVLLSPGAQILLDPSAAKAWLRVGDSLVPTDVAEGWPEFALPAVALAHGWLKHSNLYQRHRSKFSIGGERDARVQRWVISRAERTPRVQASLDRTFEELAALGRIAERAGVEVRVVLLPEHYQATDAAWRGFLEREAPFGAPPQGTPRSEPIDVLEELLAAIGLETWSLAEEARAMGHDPARYQMPDDYHWSAEGHALIADALDRELRRERLIEAALAKRAASPRSPSSP